MSRTNAAMPALTPWCVLDHLQTAEDMDGYLAACIAEDDPLLVKQALSDIVAALGGGVVIEQSADTGLLAARVPGRPGVQVRGTTITELLGSLSVWPGKRA